MNTPETIRLHRFNELVAFDTATMNFTEYLTPQQARDFAKHLNIYAEDIEKTAFCKSRITTTYLTKEKNHEQQSNDSPAVLAATSDTKAPEGGCNKSH